MKKRRLKSSVKIVIAVSMICAAFAVGRIFIDIPEKETVVSSNETAEPTAVPTPSIETYEANMFLLGDAMCQEDIYRLGLKEDGTYDFTNMFDGVLDQVSNYDLVFYNQETILGGDYLGFTLFPDFNAPQAFGDYMASKGFNLVSTANNHSLDRGEEAIINSENFWREKEDVVHAGTNLSFEEQKTIPVHEVNGITYTFNAWTYGLNAHVLPEGKEYLVNVYRNNEESMLEWVRQADALSDVVIVSMHWGDEYTSLPNEEQYTLAQELSDAGADIIIGNHAHHIQPIQWINDSTICYYALGNGISSQGPSIEAGYGQDGVSILSAMIASIKITKTVEDDQTTVTISDPHADMIYTCHDENWTYIEEKLFSDLTDEELENHDELYPKDIDIIQSLGADVTIGL